MTALDYPIGFPYGATDFPYSESLPHKGDDYDAPQGTPLVVCGVQLGLTGNSGSYKGMTYDPHLHTQAGRDEWAQEPINPRPYVKAPGTVVKTGSAPEWGLYICKRTSDGVNVFYCHLSRIDVGVGQVITGDEMIPDQKHLDMIFQRFFGRNATTEEINTWVGKKGYTELLDVLVTQPAYKKEVTESVVGEVAARDKWEQQIYALQSAVKSQDTTASQKLEQIKQILSN